MIDLSADLGEGSPGEDEIWPLIDRANVACGGHVGDDASMRAAAELARKHDVILGAHPSYPDRENFGRRSMLLPPDALRTKLKAKGIDQETPEVITYCNAGVSASFGMLVLRVAGYNQGAVYDGSWKDWGNDERRPIA